VHIGQEFNSARAARELAQLLMRPASDRRGWSVALI
jgi:hypothetical protein